MWHISMMRSVSFCLGLGAAVTLNACSGAHSAALPSTAVSAPKSLLPPLQLHKKLGFKSRGGEMESFSDAVGLILPTDQQLDKFIDPEVTGHDRIQSLEFMRMMPANKRGDFVYVNREGKVLSNRVALAQKVRFYQDGDSHLPLTVARYRQGATRTTRAYPPIGGSGGPYIRHYSAQGVNAAIGYAAFPCDTALQGGDSAFMYFNSYTANPGGSITDAGLTTAAAFGNRPQPFIKFFDELRNRYYGWSSSDNIRWPCNTSVGMLYGTIYGTGKSVLMVGIPQYDPRKYRIPPNNVQWVMGIWNFFDTSPYLTNGPGIVQGQSSPCTGCSVAKMFTISPGTDPNAHSCFGLCSTYPTPNGRWDQVFMGQLLRPCQATSSTTATCGIAFYDNNQWFGGTDVGDGGTAQYGVIGGAAWSASDINYGLEGIELGRRFLAQDIQPPPGTFQDPLWDPPPCADDGNSACGNYTFINMTSCDPGDGSQLNYPSYWQYTGYSFVTGQTSNFQGYQNPFGGECYSGMQMQTTWQLLSGPSTMPSPPQDPQTFFSDPNQPGPYDGPPY